MESGFLAIILIYGIIYLINCQLNLSDKEIRTKQVHLPKQYLYVGVFSVCFWVVLVILTYCLPDVFLNFDLFPQIVVSLCILLGLAIIVMYFNCRIDLSEDKFTYHTFWGREYTFSYTDIKRIRRTQNTIHLYTQHKHLYVDKHAEGWEGFTGKIK